MVVSEPVSEKIGTGTSVGTDIGNVWKIYDRWQYRYWEFFIFLVVSEPVSEKIGTGKSLGTGIGKIWYRKKVSEPVSEKFGTGKKSRNRYRKNLVPEKSIGIGIVKYFGYRHTLMQLQSSIIAPVVHKDILNVKTLMSLHILGFKRELFSFLVLSV